MTLSKEESQKMPTSEPAKVPPVVLEILELAKPGSNPEELEAVINRFLSQSKQSDQETEGLVAQLALMTSAQKLPVPLRQKLFGIYEKAHLGSDLMQGISGRTTILSQDVTEYFRFRHFDFDFAQLSPLGHPLADLIVDLSCKQIASKWREKLAEEKDPKLIVESYHHPKTQNPGVWMSYKGIKFDPNKFTDR